MMSFRVFPLQKDITKNPGKLGELYAVRTGGGLLQAWENPADKW